MSWRKHIRLNFWVLTTLSVLLSPTLRASDFHVHDKAATSAVSRNVQFNQLTTEDGLSQNIVYDIVQDRRGFVWFATQEGLNRYDGYTVKSYENLKDDPTTLSHDFIRALLLDRDGVLWVGTENGVNRYDEKADAFQRSPLASLGFGELDGLPIRTMLQTSDGTYWLGTSELGLVRLDMQSRTAHRFQLHDETLDLAGETVLALFEDGKGNLWVGTQDAGLLRFDPVTDQFVSYSSARSGSRGLSGREVRSIYEDHLGILWIGTADAGLSRYDPKRGIFEQFTHDKSTATSLGNNRVRDIVEDDRGTLWIATDGGLSEWRQDIQGFVTYNHKDDDPRSLLGDRVNSLFVDASGVLWVGTWDGVSKWNYFSDTFSYYRTENGLLPGNVVTSIAESADETLWIGTYGSGLAHLDLATQRTRVFRHDPEDSRSLPDDRIMAVHVDPENQVWVGTRKHGLAKLDPETSEFERYHKDPEDPRSLSGNAIASLHSDADGNLWIGTFGAGLSRTPFASPGSFDRFQHETHDPNSISGNKVISLFADRQGTLWIGTDGEGLNRFESSTGQFTRLRNFDTPSGRLKVNTPTDLIEDREGALWIGTLGNGLLRWPLQARTEGLAEVEVFGKSQGLPTDTIYGIVGDQNSALWISSNRGLTLFDPVSGTSRQFDNRNGLRNSEFHQGARLRSRSGRLLFGGSTGLVGFFPGELPINDRPPGVVITARSREQELASVATGEPTPLIEVSYLDRFLAFDFVGLDFMSPDKNQYRYQLHGFDDGWVEGDNFRRAIYTNLPPGRFSFQVQSANNDGLWNTQGAAVDVVVIPAPWNTWWAYLSYFLIAVSLLALYLHRQRAELRREARQRMLLEQEVDSRTQELAQRNSDLEALNEKLAEASVTDSLTGLRNRRYVDQFITTEIALFERNQRKATGNPVSTDQRKESSTMFFMMIDLDGFKLINDRHGHHAGDLALTQVTSVLQHCCRESDTLIRWGGDEFMIIGFAAGFFGAQVLAERIRHSIAERAYDVGNGNMGKLSASIGVAPYPLVEDRSSICSWEQVTAIADQAAYLAKANGRNAWVSIAGTTSLEKAMLAEMTTNLAELVQLQHIDLDSSLHGPLLLPGSQVPEANRASAG